MRLRMSPMRPVGDGRGGRPGTGGRPGSGNGTPGLAEVHALIVVVPFGATVTGEMGWENGEPLGSVPVTVPLTVAVLEPPWTTSVPPSPEAHVPGAIVGKTGLASPDALAARPTLESGGVVWHVELTQTCTGTLLTGTGPTVAETV